MDGVVDGVADGVVADAAAVPPVSPRRIGVSSRSPIIHQVMITEPFEITSQLRKEVLPRVLLRLTQGEQKRGREGECERERGRECVCVCV